MDRGKYRIAMLFGNPISFFAMLTVTKPDRGSGFRPIPALYRARSFHPQSTTYVAVFLTGYFVSLTVVDSKQR